MKRAIVYISLIFMQVTFVVSAQSDSSNKGISLNVGFKLFEVLQKNPPGIDLSIIRFNQAKLFWPYVTLSAGMQNIVPSAEFEYQSKAVSIKGGMLLKFPFSKTAEQQFFLRAGLGYIRRNESLALVFKDQYWGDATYIFDRNSGNVFIDFAFKADVTISKNINFYAECAFYLLGSNVQARPFEDQISYKEDIPYYYPNPGLGSGYHAGINLAVGLSILVRE